MAVAFCRNCVNFNGQMLIEGAIICTKGDKSSFYVVIPARFTLPRPRSNA